MSIESGMFPDSWKIVLVFFCFHLFLYASAFTVILPPYSKYIIQNLIRFDRSVMAYKILNKLSPESLWDKYQYRSAYSNYIMRNCKDLQIPRLKLNMPKQDFTTLP